VSTADVDPLAADRRANAWRRGAWIVAGAALAAILGAAQRTPGIVDAWTLLH
jgi:hypothetical protein